MLTLLLVCDDGDVPSSLVAMWRAAGCRLLMGRRPDERQKLLSSEKIDAIVLCQDYLPAERDALDDLRQFAPRTPVMLLRSGRHGKSAKPPGVTAICYADPEDEAVVRAFPAFLHLLLLGKAANGLRARAGEAVRPHRGMMLPPRQVR